MSGRYCTELSIDNNTHHIDTYNFASAKNDSNKLAYFEGNHPNPTNLKRNRKKTTTNNYVHQPQYQDIEIIR